MTRARRWSCQEESHIVDVLLDPVEVRVIGSLIEKQITTPEYYPLTLSALVNACNQTTNRDPVVSHDEGTVARALDSLREKNLLWKVTGSRVPKYDHRFSERFKLTAQQIAVMCVLMLRGPQTVGEIRGRTGRLHEFASLDEVEKVLESLMGAEPPLAARLPRLPGTKESRHAHLLGGEIRVPEREELPRSEPAMTEVRGENERISRLEDEVEALRQELQELRRHFLDFKIKFE